MRRFKKQITLLLAVMMILSLFVGCGKAKDTSKEASTTSGSTTGASTAAAVEDPYKDHMEISIAHWGIEGAIKMDQEDEIRDMIYKKFNITIKPVNTTWDDYTQKIQVWATSGQLPDVFSIDAITTANFEKWATQGIIHELPSDLSSYPNLKKYLDQEDVQTYKYPLGSPDAKFYCIPRPTYPTVDMWANDNAIFMRKDWMTNVGITAEPTNMDEFITLMKAFAEKDPDKNGKQDTIGLTCYSADWLFYLLLGYEPGIQSWIKDSAGKWIPGFMTDNAVQGVVALKKLYDAGGLDKDFAALKGEEGMDKFASGRAGAYAHSGYPATHASLYGKMTKVDPNIKWSDTVMQLHPFKAADGNYYRNIALTPWSESYINAKCDDKKIDRIMRFYDYFFSDEGFKLLRLGIEGKDWKQDGDNIVITRDKDETGNYVSLGKSYPICGIGNLFTWAQDFQYKNPATNPDILKMSNDMLNWEIQNCKPVPTDLRLSFLKYPSKDKQTFAFGASLIKAIMSNDAAATWNKMVTDLRANGYDKVIEELNAAAAKAGIN